MKSTKETEILHTAFNLAHCFNHYSQDKPYAKELLGLNNELSLWTKLDMFTSFLSILKFQVSELGL